MSKRTRAEEQPSHTSKKIRGLVETKLRSKEPLPQMSGKMGHFKLTGSPKRKFYNQEESLNTRQISNPAPGN